MMGFQYHTQAAARTVQVSRAYPPASTEELTPAGSGPEALIDALCGKKDAAVNIMSNQTSSRGGDQTLSACGSGRVAVFGLAQQDASPEHRGPKAVRQGRVSPRRIGSAGSMDQSTPEQGILDGQYSNLSGAGPNRLRVRRPPSP